MKKPFKIWIIIICLIMLANISIIAGGGKNHHIALFGGATTNFHLEHTDVTIGLDYEYHASHRFGVGIIGDYVMADYAETLVLVGVFYHPVSSVKLIIGNGLAFTEETETTDLHDDHGDSNPEAGTTSHYVLRLGVGYDLHVDNISFGPSIAWDSINGHSSIAYGVTVGMYF